MDMKVAWDVTGEASTIPVRYSKKADHPVEEVPSVDMDAQNCRFYKVSGFTNEILEVRTKDKTRVNMMKTDAAGFHGPEDLKTFIKNIAQHMQQQEASGYDKASFPMVDFREKGTNPWLVGTTVGKTYIRQAVYQNSIQMNENGARFRAAAAVEDVVMGVHETKWFLIDGPFMMWFVRDLKIDGKIKPVTLFNAFTDRSHMKNPGVF